MLQLRLRKTWRKRTSTLSGDTLVPSDAQVAAGDDVRAGTYIFSERFEIDPQYDRVVEAVGQEVLCFTGGYSGGRLYLFAQARPFKALPGTIGVPPAVFRQIANGTEPYASEIVVTTAFFSFGGIPLLDHPYGAIDADLVRYRKVQREAEPQLQPAPAAPQQRRVIRSRYTPPPRDEQDELADFIFMSTFPDVAPIYRPSSFWAWYLWWNQQNEISADTSGNEPVQGGGGQFGGGGASGAWDMEGPVPGFPDAAGQRVVQEADGRHVQVLDADGNVTADFKVSAQDGVTRFETASGSVFNFTQDGGRQALEYADDVKSFVWDGNEPPLTGDVGDLPDLEAAVGIGVTTEGIQAEPLDGGAPGTTDMGAQAAAVTAEEWTQDHVQGQAQDQAQDQTQDQAQDHAPETEVNPSDMSLTADYP